jgi:hypothetical protein
MGGQAGGSSGGVTPIGAGGSSIAGGNKSGGGGNTQASPMADQQRRTEIAKMITSGFQRAGQQIGAGVGTGQGMQPGGGGFKAAPGGSLDVPDVSSIPPMDSGGSPELMEILKRLGIGGGGGTGPTGIPMSLQ